jgi:hypothetical protein
MPVDGVVEADSKLTVLIRYVIFFSASAFEENSNSVRCSDDGDYSVIHGVLILIAVGQCFLWWSTRRDRETMPLHALR